MLFSHALVVLSGGQDSTTCLFLAKLRLAKKVSALTFMYGQRHVAEVAAAQKIAALANAERHEKVDIGPILAGTSPLVNSTQQVEHYRDAESLPGGIEKTFVPMRNALFLVLAMNRAAVWGCDAIVTGVSQEDYGGYPDCREEFIDDMRRVAVSALGESVSTPISLITPLIDLTKERTVKLAVELGPQCMNALAYSHTCYEGVYPPCGTCHACLLRAKGFAAAGVVDPLLARAYKGE